MEIQKLLKETEIDVYGGSTVRHFLRTGSISVMLRGGTV